MMKTLSATLVLTAFLAASPAPAQESDKKSECGMAQFLCPQKGHCEGDCRKICDATGELILSVRSKIVARMEKECGQACACAKDSSAPPCAVCEFLKTRVVAPILKDKIKSHLKHPEAAVSHACTFLKGSTCEGCASELADVLWEKFRVVLFDRIADFKGAVRAQAIGKITAAGGQLCDCLKGAAPGASCSDPACESLKKTVVMPLLREKVEARLKYWDLEASHTVKAGTTFPCTFLKGRVCWTCADETAGQILAKLAEAKASQK